MEKNRQGQKARPARRNKEEEQERTLLLEYITFAKRSAMPPRFNYLFVILTSVVAFSASWNSLEGGWVNARIVSLKNAIECASQEQRPKNTTPQQRENWDQAQRVFKAIGTKNPNILKGLLNSLERNRTAYVRMVRVPFLGVTFDINDLGIFAGILLTVGLMMFIFSLASEQRNTHLALNFAVGLDRKFSCAGDGDSRRHERYTYDLLSMNQVVIVPPSAVGKKSVWRWRRATKIALVFPTLAQALIVGNDAATLEIGRAMNESGAIVGVLVGSCLLMLVGGLSLWASTIWRGIEKLWLKHAEQLDIPHTAEE